MGSGGWGLGGWGVGSGALVRQPETPSTPQKWPTYRPPNLASDAVPPTVPGTVRWDRFRSESRSLFQDRTFWGSCWFSVVVVVLLLDIFLHCMHSNHNRKNKKLLWLMSPREARRDAGMTPMRHAIRIAEGSESCIRLGLLSAVVFSSFICVC